MMFSQLTHDQRTTSIMGCIHNKGPGSSRHRTLAVM